MAGLRKREVHPGFWRNEDLVELSRDHRLAFIGLWALADREGRLVDRPRKIRLEAFPNDPDLDMEKIVSDLAAGGFLVRYESHGTRLLEICNFSKFQHIHPHERKSELAPPRVITSSTNVQPTSGHVSPLVANGSRCQPEPSEPSGIKSEAAPALKIPEPSEPSGPTGTADPLNPHTQPSFVARAPDPPTAPVVCAEKSSTVSRETARAPEDRDPPFPKDPKLLDALLVAWNKATGQSLDLRTSSGERTRLALRALAAAAGEHSDNPAMVGRVAEFYATNMPDSRRASLKQFAFDYDQRRAQALAKPKTPASKADQLAAQNRAAFDEVEAEVQEFLDAQSKP